MKNLVLLFFFTSLFSTQTFAKASEVKWKTLAEFNLTKNTFGPELKKVLDKEVIVKGFMIPLDMTAKEIKEFLLVPYVPSCQHVPPPPGNQIVHIFMKGGKAKMSYFPISVRGKLQVIKKKKEKKNNTEDPMMFMPEASFKLETSKVTEIKN